MIASKNWVIDLLNKCFKKIKPNLPYSTDEQVVGEWIDGSPIYRKVFQFTSPSTGNSAQDYNLNVPIDTLVKLDGYILSSLNTYFKLSTASNITSTDQIFFAWLRKNNSSTNPNTIAVKIGTNKNWLSRPMYFIIEYTKPSIATLSLEENMEE